MKELSLKLAVPELVVVVKKELSVGVEAGHLPQAIRVLRAQVLDTRSLTGGKNFEMCGFVDVFLDKAIVVDTFDEEELLSEEESTLSLE
jgi:hypothetical protein